MGRVIWLAPLEDRVITDRGRRVRITGHCNRCGACCESGDPDTGEPGVCRYFRRDADGLGMCTDRTPANTYYWQGCRFWPNRASHIARYPTCTYVVREA